MKPDDDGRDPALPEHLLSAAEVANCYGTTARTILRLARAGRIPCVRFTARLVRFRASDVRELLRQALVECTALSGRRDDVAARRETGPKRTRKR